MCGLISTEVPYLTSGNFESSLASDKVLAHFFNDFLSLPSFSDILVYNQDTGLLEVVTGAAHFVYKKIKSALKRRRSPVLSGDLMVLMGAPPADDTCTVSRLDREEGIQWLKRERLTYFLQSDYHHQYRLAKLLLQWDTNFNQSRKSSSSQTSFSASKLQSCPQLSKESFNAPTWSRSQENVSAEQGVSAHPKREKTQKLHSSHRKSTPSAAVRENYLKESFYETQSSEKHLEYLAFKVVNQVIREAVNMVHNLSQANASRCAAKSGHQTSCSSTDEGKNCALWKPSGDEDGESCQDGLRRSRRTEQDEKSWVMGSKITNQENRLDVCWHSTCWVCTRPALDEFQEFLQGTPGENLLDLWMDIERLRATQHSERKNRYLVLMRSWYLVSSSPSRLNEELLSTLGLTTPLCWTEEKLRSVQPSITESLLCYWAPRFWSSRCVQGVSPGAELRTRVSYSKAMTSVQPCHGSAPLNNSNPHPSSSQSPHAAHDQLLPGRLWLCEGRTEKMLQALNVESFSGMYFTHFCEQSGNQLWVNAVYFWTDLMHYHELFCQDGPDPYKVQREAQLLYSTYIFSSARRSINVDVGIQREVYDQLQPAFEELFDDVEEYALNILLEPWTLLISRDKTSLQQVCLQEDVQCINSHEYRDLQNLYEESDQKLRQCRSKLLPSASNPSNDSSEDPQPCGYWSSVSPSYHGYRLGSLLRQPFEIGQFLSFLQKQDASIHLMCWLDLEQYRRTSQMDEDIKQERSSHIAAKYLNKKYFFGSDSPGTAEEQNHILRWAGGLERLKSPCLSEPVVMEIQEIIRNHIEETWLPLFLSSKEFAEGQKHQKKLQTADRLSQHVYSRRRARRKAWKVQGLWMNTSTEAMLFRRVLLNPTTRQQFQHFVSLKGDFLENDVRFWVEVQKYKDLCHSHCDEATIHQKISIIISCFINSSMPPTLQIDIPADQAQRILEKCHQLGPYIFREAQVLVFSELLRFWPEFQEFSSTVQDEQLLPLLQKKRIKLKNREWRQRRKEEEDERRAQEEQERELCGREEEDEGDNEDDKQQEETSETLLRTQSRRSLNPPHSLLWSYSKYMAGLKREEMLLRRQSQVGTSFSTASDFSTDCSFRSASSQRGSSRTDSKKNRSDSRKHQNLWHEKRLKCKN